jgi:uncharacterized protein YegL
MNYFTSDDGLLSGFSNGDFEIKVARKVPVCLVLDTSGSMTDSNGWNRSKIDELNKHYSEFLAFVRKDDKARQICDLSVITFGDSVDVVNGYSNIEAIKESKFQANGPTPMGKAMKKAYDLLELRRSYYKQNDIEHYKPIVILMTDGEPTDDYGPFSIEFSQKVVDKKVVIIPIIIGKNPSAKALNALKAFSPRYEPKRIISSDDFAVLFRVLSSSVSNPAKDPWDEFMAGGSGESM